MVTDFYNRTLLSTAVSLAQEIGCFSQDVLTNTVIAKREAVSGTVRLEWNRTLCTFIHLTDQNLSLRLRLEPQLPGTRCGNMINQLHQCFSIDSFWESAIELATHTDKARELLYSWRSGELGAQSAALTASWERFRRGLDGWKRQHAPMNNGTSIPVLFNPCGMYAKGKPGRDLSLRSVCLRLDYFYVRLCGLSPAAHVFESSSGDYKREPYMSILSELADDAIKTSVDLLNCVTYDLPPSTLFTYVGVRYWLYIVCASLFLLKVRAISAKSQMHQSNNHIGIGITKSGGAAGRQPSTYPPDTSSCASSKAECSR